MVCGLSKGEGALQWQGLSLCRHTELVHLSGSIDMVVRLRGLVVDTPHAHSALLSCRTPADGGTVEPSALAA